ncbi:MAG: Inorganic phosphate transporter [Parachlamydiales bacterium]|nr:Inorganic phosphate transporter [Parachlamydiales bacterium]
MLEVALLIVFLGLLFDYTNGFHDAANVVSTVIATRVLAPFSAIVMAGILNCIGATHVSGVAETIATGLVDSAQATQVVVLCAVIGAIIWNFITWYFGLPSSSSYALIGGLLGAAWMHHGTQSILWSGVIFKVIIPMIVSPILGFGIGYLLMKVLYHYVGKRPDLKEKKIFSHLQIGSACIIALAHGLNDAQKSMGIITLGLFVSGFLTTTQIPIWVVLACALTIGLGTASGGFRIIRTMGFRITRIEPFQGFAAESSASIVILAASFMGMPVSSTHMIAGSITGVGSARSMDSVRWNVPRKIVFALILTLPGAGIVGASAYIIARIAGLQ